MASTKINGPFLVVAPLSLLYQWQAELATWSPNMNCIVFHGNAAARDIIVNNEFFFQEEYTSKQTVQQMKKLKTCKFNVLLTTFEMAMKDIKLIAGIRWKVKQLISSLQLFSNCCRY
jgi:SNF2 family DNA or RNA helicase